MARGKQIIKLIDKSISECFAIYIKNCRVKNLSPQTITTYKQMCNYFIEWYGADESVRNINTEVIEDYIIFLQEKNKSQVYVCTIMRQLRAFLYFCMEREYLPNFKITLPKADEVIKEPYTDKELEKLLKKPETGRWTEWRNWAMVNYFVSTGNRLNTAVNVKIGDVDFENSLIKLNVLKNRKQQLIPMSSGLKKVLQTYLSLWEHDTDDYLFPEYEGGQFTTQGAYCALKQYNIERGVTKTSVHLYRHTYAKNYIIAGGDCTYLQRLLGHSTLTMTNHYINLYATDLQRNYDKFNPLDNIMNATK